MYAHITMLFMAVKFSQNVVQDVFMPPAHMLLLLFGYMMIWCSSGSIHMIFFSYTDDARACDSMLQDLCLSCSNALCNLRLYTADEPCLEQLVSSFLRPLQRLEFSIPRHGSLQERLHTSQILQQCLWWRSFSLHGQREGDGIISYGVRLYPTHTMKLDIFFTPWMFSGEGAKKNKPSQDTKSGFCWIKLTDWASACNWAMFNVDFCSTLKIDELFCLILASSKNN